MSLEVSQDHASSRLSYFDGHKVSAPVVRFFSLVTLGIFFDSFDLANFGYTAPSITKFWGLGMGWVGTTNALGSIGWMFGALLSGWFCDKVGRKKGFLAAATCYGVMTILCGLAPNPTFFMWCRFVTMMGTMGLSVVAMVYLAEMAPADKRGRLQLRSVGLAMTAVPLSGFFARWIVTFGPEGWRWQYYLGGVFALVVVILVWLKAPESPRWLVSKGRGDEAKRILEKMLPGVTVDPAAVTAAVTEYRNVERLGTWQAMKALWAPLYRGRLILLVLMGIVVSNTASTIQLMMPTLFKARGLSLSNAILIVSLMGWGAPVGVSIASFILDKGARKIPLAINGIATAVLLTVLGLIDGFLPMAFVGLLANLCNPIYYFSCQVYTTESFATNIRSTATGVVMGASRAAAAIWMIYIAAMYSAWGFSGFLAFTGACLFVVQIGLLLFGHQTSRRSLEEISGGK